MERKADKELDSIGSHALTEAEFRISYDFLVRIMMEYYSQMMWINLTNSNGDPIYDDILGVSHPKVTRDKAVIVNVNL